MRAARHAAGGLLAALSWACGSGAAHSADPIARVGGVVLDGSVVRHLAQRDGIDAATAHTHAVQVLRLAAAAEQQRVDGGEADPAPLVTPARERQLLRAARARLWLDEGFERSATPSDIPAEDPMLARALASQRFTHAQLHSACQIVVVPKGVTTLAQATQITPNPAWRARAKALLDPVARRIQRYVPAGDRNACTLMARVFPIARPPSSPAPDAPGPADDLELRYEGQAMFDLKACADPRLDGSCARPTFDPAWTTQVATMTPASYSAVFASGWGLHVVYFSEIVPAIDARDATVQASIREQIHAPWLGERFMTYLDQLQQRRAVRVASDWASDDAGRVQP